MSIKSKNLFSSSYTIATSNKWTKNHTSFVTVIFTRLTKKTLITSDIEAVSISPGPMDMSVIKNGMLSRLEKMVTAVITGEQTKNKLFCN